MSEPVAMPPRTYTVWLWWERFGTTPPEFGPLRRAIERDPDELDAFFDAAAQRLIDHKLVRDLAAWQHAGDQWQRALVRRHIGELSEPQRAAVEASLEQSPFFATTPLGGAVVTCVSTAVTEDEKSKKPPAVVPPLGLLVFRKIRVTGSVLVAEPAAGPKARPSREALTALQRAVVSDAKTWRRWCNLLVLHSAWEGGQISCLRAATKLVPEALRAELDPWLAEREWYRTEGAGAFRMSFQLEGASAAIVERGTVRA